MSISLWAIFNGSRIFQPSSHNTVCMFIVMNSRTFVCPLLWIPALFEMIEGAGPTFIGDSTEGMQPMGVLESMRTHKWTASWTSVALLEDLYMSKSFFMYAIMFNSFIDRASTPTPYRGACLYISSWSEDSGVWMSYCRNGTNKNY